MHPVIITLIVFTGIFFLIGIIRYEKQHPTIKPEIKNKTPIPIPDPDSDRYYEWDLDFENDKKPSITIEETSPKIIHSMQFKAKGVTFKDGRLSRQAALRRMYYQEEYFEDGYYLSFDRFEYEGSPAFYIVASGDEDRIVGTVPADLVPEINKYYNYKTVISDTVYSFKSEDKWIYGLDLNVDFYERD